MTTTVNILYTGKGTVARNFATAIIKMSIVDKIRAKASNLRYEYFLPIEDEHSVLLIDEW